MKFTANYNDRLNPANGNEILTNGKKLGESFPQKGSYWGVWKYKGDFFISLNDQNTDFWEADEEDSKNYNDIPC